MEKILSSDEEHLFLSFSCTTRDEFDDEISAAEREIIEWQSVCGQNAKLLTMLFAGPIVRFENALIFGKLMMIHDSDSEFGMSMKRISQIYGFITDEDGKEEALYKFEGKLRACSIDNSERGNGIRSFKSQVTRLRKQ